MVFALPGPNNAGENLGGGVRMCEDRKGTDTIRPPQSEGSSEASTANFAGRMGNFKENITKPQMRDLIGLLIIGGGDYWQLARYPKASTQANLASSEAS